MKCAARGWLEIQDAKMMQKIAICAPTHNFSRLDSVTAQPNCGVEQRATPVFGRAAITLGIGPHF